MTIEQWKEKKKEQKLAFSIPKCDKKESLDIELVFKPDLC
jgi:hypothetical protein